MDKICTKCGINKPLEDYYKENRVKDGRCSACKSCINARITKYSKTNKGKLTTIKAQSKYIKSDKGKLKRTEYAKSPEGKAARARVDHNRRINIANSTCTLTAKEFNYIIYLQDNKCACCSKTFNENLKPTRDHIVPVNKGGDFTVYTVQALCVECNSKKGIKYIEYRTNYHKEMIARI